jgi:hypothetical protein
MQEPMSALPPESGHVRCTRSGLTALASTALGRAEEWQRLDTRESLAAPAREVVAEK